MMTTQDKQRNNSNNGGSIGHRRLMLESSLSLSNCDKPVFPPSKVIMSPFGRRHSTTTTTTTTESTSSSSIASCHHNHHQHHNYYYHNFFVTIFIVVIFATQFSPVSAALTNCNNNNNKSEMSRFYIENCRGNAVERYMSDSCQQYIVWAKTSCMVISCNPSGQFGLVKPLLV